MESPVDLASYICAACAEQHGGVWPKDHVATFHQGICDLHGDHAALAHWTDWDWPKREAADERAKIFREF